MSEREGNKLNFLPEHEDIDEEITPGSLSENSAGQGEKLLNLSNSVTRPKTVSRISQLSNPRSRYPQREDIDEEEAPRILIENTENDRQVSLYPYDNVLRQKAARRINRSNNPRPSYPPLTPEEMDNIEEAAKQVYQKYHSLTYSLLREEFKTGNRLVRAIEDRYPFKITGLKTKLGIEIEPGIKKPRVINSQIISGPNIVDAENATYINEDGIEFVGWRRFAKELGYEASFIQSCLRRAIYIPLQRAVTQDNHLITMFPHREAAEFLVNKRMEKLTSMSLNASGSTSRIHVDNIIWVPLARFARDHQLNLQLLNKCLEGEKIKTFNGYTARGKEEYFYDEVEISKVVEEKYSLVVTIMQEKQKEAEVSPQQAHDELMKLLEE